MDAVETSVQLCPKCRGKSEGTQEKIYVGKLVQCPQCKEYYWTDK